MRGFPKTATIASGEFIINLRQTRDVSAYIDSWRDQLVDLTKKNSLLNFKPGKTTSLPISVPTGHKVIGLLLNGLSVPISFLRIETKPKSPIEETTDAKPTWELRTNFNTGLVYADFIESDLKTRLTNLTRRTNQEFLDRGLWTLYLAYGQLNWRDIDNEEYKSPLLLLPIKIEYATEVNGFVMTRTEDDIVVNPALLIKSEKLGITIPMPNLDVEGFSGNEWLADINESLSNTEGWAASDLAVISRFSFFKEAMYKDLLENVQKISENPIVLAIVDPENYPLVGGDLVLADEVDEVAPPEKIPLVLDSDSSQRAAIATALKGSSLVIDGPPGTGKSQTITNLIGAFLNEGKTVLFVSEKSAALDVVKNRLAAAGLDSYILEIHSHKATRKDVASELGRALIYKPTPPRGLSESEIGRAAALRELLAQASEASNKIRPPFGKSFNDVVGAVAQLHTYPDVTPSQKFQGDFSIEKLSEIRSIGQRATKFWRPALEGQKFLWRGVKNETSKTELLSNLKNRVKDLESALFPYSDWVHNFQWEIQRLPSLLQFITFAEVNHAHLDEEWLTSPDLALQRSQFALLEESTSVIKEFQRDVDEIYSLDKTFFTKTFSIELKNNPINLDDWAALTLRELGQSKRELDIFSKALSKVIPLADQIDLELELKLATGISPLRVRHDLLNVVTSEFKPKFSWIRGSGLKEVESEFLKLKEAFDRMGQYQRNSDKYWSDSIVELPIEQLIIDFTHKFKGLKHFSVEARTARKLLSTRSTSKLKRKDILPRLNIALDYLNYKKAYESLLDGRSEEISYLIDGATPAWNRMEECITSAHIIKRTIGSVLSERQRDLLTFNHNFLEIEKYKELKADLKIQIDNLETSFEFIPQTYEKLNNSSFEKITSNLDDIQTWLSEAIEVLTLLNEARTDGNEVSLRTLEEILEKQNRYVNSLNNLSDNQSLFRNSFRPFYENLASDLEPIALKFKVTEEIFEQASAPLTANQIALLKNARELNNLSVQSAHNSFMEVFSEFLDVFDETESNRIKEYFCDIPTSLNAIDSFEHDRIGPNEWINFANLQNDAAAAGFLEPLTFCTARQVDGDDVEPILTKAFLSAWLEKLIDEESSLSHGSSLERSQVVEEFQALDLKLIKESIAPIITNANQLRPQNHLGASGIIRSESLKSRKHMSIRELLTKSQDAAQAIKPIFMMSPLSVSQFLPPDMKFDVVIFDEASQVRPADAINCIYRGKQLIIAGDDKQLPPTSYWESSDDGENEDDEVDATDFESILDMSKRAMATRSLLWHYRSRHEDLITFSNRKFYDGKLFTFPSAKQISEDLGVAFFKVDGVYRRGTSRDNPIEARAVADRVEHHFDNRIRTNSNGGSEPLSVGVVTFSEAQKVAVEREVDLLRLRRPDFEKFFSDDRLKGFFVKNLESVQGDERDVIIFSIGYGFDENGAFKNNFGPLNKAKGWRRLNVAITRALHRVEVVSSITASDISDAANVKFVKDYLAYAEHGPKILDIAFDSRDGDTDSPFEDSVKASIQKMGYVVHSQVGTAGYRIDLGITHPDRDGVYVLGVECDGYAYHSSKIARDRDRLRQQVLEGLGWRIHRIWGTAWYRNRDSEEHALKRAIENAINSEDAWVGLVPNSAESHKVELQEEELPDAPKWSVRYLKAQLTIKLDQHIKPGDIQAQSYMSKFLYSVIEQEGPISTNLLKERLRECWGIGQFGANISTNFEVSLQNLVSGTKVSKNNGGFYSLPNAVIQVRTPGSIKRGVEEISPEEIILAISNFVNDSVQIDRAELLTAVIRLFGWERTGRVIQDTLDAAFEIGVARGWYAELEGVVTRGK